MTRRRSGAARQRVAGGLLLTFALLLLFGTLGLSISMVEQTSDLGAKVKLTEGIVDGNVRTLSQVQRELLRLSALLSQDDPRWSDVRFQEALVSQRVQEGSLSYQIRTLGTKALLRDAQALAQRWQTRTKPLVDAAVRDPDAPRTARARALAAVKELELGYNQLVSDGEINRKVRAGEANRESRLMLQRAHRLMWGLIVTFVTVLLLLTFGGVAYTRFHRQRERAGQELLTLNQELQQYAHVVRSTDNMVVITDAAGLITWVNTAFEEATGYRLDEVVGRKPGDLLQGKGTDPTTVAAMSEALRAGRGFSVEVLNYSRAGQPLWVALEVDPLHDESMALTGFVGLGTDVTERREAERLMREAKENAEETAREKSRFLASMSHEIRTPLNAVLGLTDLLLLTELDEQQREFVGTAHTSGQLLLALVNDILDYSALDAGRLDLEDRAFRLDTMLRDTVGMFRTEAKRRGVALLNDAEQEVPTMVRGDETRIRQILVNLLGNGLKFTESGQVDLEARVVARDADSARVQFVVSDTGIGIPADRMARLFQPFSQVDASTTRRYGGSGLGLSICRLLVDRMGGTIEVSSKPGVGSTFVVELPLGLADAHGLDDTGVLDADADPAHDGAPASALRVLLAEDDRVNQTVSVHMLRRLGIEPVVVGDGQAAVTAATSRDFDLVLMDVHMPLLDGVQATTAIDEQLGPDRPRIVAVTANALEGDRERLLASGFDDYVSKPMRLEDLAAALRRARAAGAGAVAEQLDASDAVDVLAWIARTGIRDIPLLESLVDDLLAEAYRLLSQAPAALGAGQADELARDADELAVAAVMCAAEPLTVAARDLAEAASTDTPQVRRQLACLADATAALLAWREARTKVMTG